MIYDEEENAFSRLAYGFGHGDFKEEADWMKTSFYGMEDGDFEKEYIDEYVEESIINPR